MKTAEKCREKKLCVASIVIILCDRCAFLKIKLYAFWNQCCTRGRESVAEGVFGRPAKRYFSKPAGETKLPLAKPGKGLCGAPGGNRTHNLRRRRPTLYPIALRVHAKRFPVLSLSPSRRRSARRKENFGCNEARQGSAIFLPLPFYRLLFSYVQRALSASFPPLRGEAGASPLLRALFLRSLSPLPRKSR